MKIIDTVRTIEKSEKRGKNLGFNTRKVVIGNKADLKLSKHILSKEDKAELDGLVKVDVSAMTNQGVKDIFNSVVQSLAGDTFVRKEVDDLLRLNGSSKNQIFEKSQHQQLKDLKQKSRPLANPNRPKGWLGGLFGADEAENMERKSE